MRQPACGGAVTRAHWQEVFLFRKTALARLMLNPFQMLCSGEKTSKRCVSRAGELYKTV